MPFEKYAAAAQSLTRPASAARALQNGAPNIERADKLVQLIAKQKGLSHPAIDAQVALVDRGWRPTARRRRRRKADDWMGTKLSAALIAAIVMVPAPAITQSAIDTELAPGVQLRFWLNGANSTIVTRNADGGVGGVAPELGRFIAPRLGASFVPCSTPRRRPTPTAWRSSRSGTSPCTGRNPRADAKFDYSPDVIAVEYVLLAAPGKAFADASEVDRAGVTIAVARNASADVFLSRSLKSAELAGGRRRRQRCRAPARR